ncbi:hypothetical protein FRC20_008242 [Serendipita sp. 405]|nr:hypothetical protein FRC16_007977 [Serendipita sp. 398]KAG8866526.1 hypothetical protein FRC20_008242 [Serendipita sp. 405]
MCIENRSLRTSVYGIGGVATAINCSLIVTTDQAGPYDDAQYLLSGGNRLPTAVPCPFTRRVDNGHLWVKENRYQRSLASTPLLPSNKFPKALFFSRLQIFKEPKIRIYGPVAPIFQPVVHFRRTGRFRKVGATGAIGNRRS